MTIYKLNDEFRLEWLKSLGFWRLIYFSIRAKFGDIAVTAKDCNGMRISVGTDEPIIELWDNKGYTVKKIGKVLDETVLMYYKN